MSFDLQLPTVCSHRVFREGVTLEDDFRSIRPSKPLAASININLYASENLIPKTMYSIIFDPDAINVNQPRMIYLRNNWRSPSDYFELSYVTFRSTCPRCSGLEVLDDISYDSVGALKTVRDEKLLLQNVEKFTVTEIGSNYFHKFIGTSIVTFLGERVLDTDYLANKITQEINMTLNKFQNMQEQYQLTGRPVTDGEILETIENIEVTSDDDDPTILRAEVTIIARSGKRAQFAQYLRIREG